MERVMGPLPDPSQRVPLNVEIISQEELEGYSRIKLRYRSTPNERVPAWLLVPHPITPQQSSAKKYPAMLCLHQTTPSGKNSPVGLADSPSLHYAHELAMRGYVCIVPDYPTFGEYGDESNADDQFVSGSMKGIWNNLRAVDLLESRADVHRERIGVIGHSLGGHHGIFTAVFDLRLRAIISSCGYTSFHDYYGGDLTGWTGPRYMPRIREMFSSDPDQVPFSFHELIAALAPRPFFSCSPLHDKNFSVKGVREVIEAAQGVYQLHDAQDAMRVEYPDCGHQFPDHERLAAYDWLDKVMGKAP
jgi:pimeloyl-ACP methyl ester carboxylesterase